MMTAAVRVSIHHTHRSTEKGFDEHRGVESDCLILYPQSVFSHSLLRCLSALQVVTGLLGPLLLAGSVLSDAR